MALQHIYARIDKGLYTGGPGYDTAQVSEGISREYAEGNIQRFCFYHEHSFKDIMPNIYFLANIKSGGLIFGRNIFIRADRSSFLSHSIIVSELEELQYAYENYDSVLGYNNFYSKAETGLLPKADIRNVEITDMFYTRDLLFELLSINEGSFKAVLYAVINSIFEDRQLIIKLNAPRSVCSWAARELLRYIFAVLPISLREKISFITYATHFNLPAYFNIIFADPATDLDNVACAILDLTKNINYNHQNEYLSFAWLNIRNANRIFLQRIITNTGNWNKLIAEAKESYSYWQSVEVDTNILIKNIKNYYPWLIRLSADLCSIDGGRGMDIIYQLKTAKKELNYSPVVTAGDLEYLFFKDFEIKTLYGCYSSLAGLCKMQVYGLMSERLNKAKNEFEFLILGLLYKEGIKKYFNKSFYCELSDELSRIISERVDGELKSRAYLLWKDSERA